jgi:hypothetical protein
MLKTDNRRYVTLDHYDDRELAKTNPSLFIQRYEPPVMIDEIQYAPELFPYIKIYVDKKRENGLFWLTGSQKFNLMQGIQESLAGRVAALDMLGFSYKETQNRADETIPFIPSVTRCLENTVPEKELLLMDLYQVIFNGSFPRLIVNKGKGRDVFFKSYLQTYIERDIKDFHGISNDLKFYNFVRAVAVRTGNLLNYADLSRDVEIDIRTVKTWLALLERSGLVVLLAPYYQNPKKRIVKTPKIYFLDTGLCSYLAGWYSAEQLQFGAMSGSIFETFVISEIIKGYRNRGINTLMRLSYYRDKDQKEIDLIIEENGVLYPIEIKKTVSPNAKDIINFKVLTNEKNKKIGDGALIYSGDEIMFLKDDVRAIPLAFL